MLALYAWCALMGAVAVALRFVSYKDADGTIDPVGAIGLSVGPVVAVAAAIYLVYVLEILKWRSTPVVTAGAPAHRRPPLPGTRRPLTRGAPRGSAERRDDHQHGAPNRSRRSARAGS